MSFYQWFHFCSIRFVSYFLFFRNFIFFFLFFCAFLIFVSLIFKNSYSLFSVLLITSPLLQATYFLDFFILFRSLISDKILDLKYLILFDLLHQTRDHFILFDYFLLQILNFFVLFINRLDKMVLIFNLRLFLNLHIEFFIIYLLS